MDRLTPITPGELLDEEFLQPLGVSQYRLAKAIDVPASRISEIVAGRRAISADTDLRLCRYLGLSPGYWLRAQAAHDTEVVSAELAEEIARIEPLVGSTAAAPSDVTPFIGRGEEPAGEHRGKRCPRQILAISKDV